MAAAESGATSSPAPVTLEVAAQDITAMGKECLFKRGVVSLLANDEAHKTPQDGAYFRKEFAKLGTIFTLARNSPLAVATPSATATITKPLYGEYVEMMGPHCRCWRFPRHPREHAGARWRCRRSPGAFTRRAATCGRAQRGWRCGGTCTGWCCSLSLPKL